MKQTRVRKQQVTRTAPPALRHKALRGELTMEMNNDGLLKSEGIGKGEAIFVRRAKRVNDGELVVIRYKGDEDCQVGRYELDGDSFNLDDGTGVLTGLLRDIEVVGRVVGHDAFYGLDVIELA
jgi:hypothetical protein